MRSPVSADAFAGGAIALLRALADDKKARNGLRWLMAAAYKAGYEPRVGNISLYKLQPRTTSSSPAVEPEEPCTQATGRKRRRKRKRKRQAELDGLAGSDAEMQEQECTDVPPAPSSLSPVLETDHATHPEPQRLTYAATAAARSPPCQPPTPGGKRAAPAVLASPAKQPARPERGPVDEVSAYLQQQLKERQWDYDLVSLAADARVTDDGNLVGLQVPRTCEAASWEPNDVYDELRHAGFSGCSEEDQEETFNRFLKPAAPPDSGNGVVVPHEAPDGPPKPKKKGKK